MKKHKGKEEVKSERIAPLLTPEEVNVELGKTSSKQIIFPTQGRPMRLKRLTYKPLPYGENMSSIGLDLKGYFEDY